MRKLEQDTNRLVIEEKPTALRYMCVVLAVTLLSIGLLFRPIFTLISTDQTIGKSASNGWFIGQSLICASAIIPVGVLAFVFKTRRIIFDPPAILVTRERRGIFGCGVSDYPFASLAGAGLEHSYDSSGGRTRRTVLEFVDGHRAVPLKPYYQSGNRSEHVAVKINEWQLSRDKTLGGAD